MHPICRNSATAVTHLHVYSLATKTYPRIHFVDSEARVEVCERRYGGTNLFYLKKNRSNEMKNVSGKIHTQEVVRAVSAEITLALLL